MRKKNRLRRQSAWQQKNMGRTILVFLILAMAAGGAWVGFRLFETEKPKVGVAEKVKFVGSHVTMALTAGDARSGLRSVRVTLEQGDKVMDLFHRQFERRAWFSMAGAPELKEKVVLDARAAGATEGKADLVVTARDFSLKGLFKGNQTVLRMPVVIDTRAPAIMMFYTPPAVRSGGSGIVVYKLSEPAVRHGVMMGDRFFPGFPLADGQRFVVYLGVPWNAEDIGKTRVIAVDAAGNEGSKVFGLRLRKVRFKKDRINVSDGFLKRKIPEFKEHYSELKGSLLDIYLEANNTIRRRNAETIAKVCENPGPEQLWQGRFLRMPGADKAGFGDQRTYFYNNKAVDHQTHLGVDIASTARVAIRAANRGKVIFADYLGIYGNTVILDHGQGVFSLYAHLSRFDTSPGQMVDKKQVIAHSGATGMAGGDHLHFSMLIHGIFVTPREWWDSHWLKVDITDVLGVQTDKKVH